MVRSDGDFRRQWRARRRVVARGIVLLLPLAMIARPAATSPQVAASSTPRPPSQLTGRIEGVVSISARLITPRLRVRVYDEPGGAPPAAAPEAEEHPYAGVVLYLESPDANTRLRGGVQSLAQTSALRQRNIKFVPHVLPVLAGSTVEFPNDDEVFHNVFSLSSARTFDLGRYPRGSSRSVRFPTPGVVRVFCHIHADMSGIVLVRDNPFFIVPDSGGRFALDGVPPGDYRLVAWHERIRPIGLRVRVASDRTTPVSMRIPLPRQADDP